MQLINVLGNGMLWSGLEGTGDGRYIEVVMPSLKLGESKSTPV